MFAIIIICAMLTVAILYVIYSIIIYQYINNDDVYYGLLNNVSNSHTNTTSLYIACFNYIERFKVFVKRIYRWIHMRSVDHDIPLSSYYAYATVGANNNIYDSDNVYSNNVPTLHQIYNNDNASNTSHMSKSDVSSGSDDTLHQLDTSDTYNTNDVCDPLDICSKSDVSHVYIASEVNVNEHTIPIKNITSIRSNMSASMHERIALFEANRALYV